MKFLSSILESPAIRKWAYNCAGFNRYGLRRDDVLYESEIVTEAIRRMPVELQDERVFRLRRAMQLSANKVYLPKDQWTKFEEDESYISPYLRRVQFEHFEQEYWGTEFLENLRRKKVAEMESKLNK